MSGCAHRHAALKTSANPAPTLAADSLIVSLDDVRRITGSTDLEPDSRGVGQQPRHVDSHAPGPCQALYQETAFGTGWAQFRSAVYTASNRSAPGGPKKFSAITQVVGIYSDNGARAAFDRVSSALTTCSALGVKSYDFTVAKPDSSTVEVKFPPRGHTTAIYRAKSTVLIEVMAAGFQQTDQIADAVLQIIADRIK